MEQRLLKWQESLMARRGSDLRWIEKDYKEAGILQIHSVFEFLSPQHRETTERLCLISMQYIDSIIHCQLGRKNACLTIIWKVKHSSLLSTILDYNAIFPYEEVMTNTHPLKRSSQYSFLVKICLGHSFWTVFFHLSASWLIL